MRNLILTFVLSLPVIGTTLAQGPGCPSIDVVSYQGTNLSSITLPCDSSCVTLTANVFQIAQTSSYTVSSLPWSGMPYPTSTGVQLSVDDQWSGIINLPFNFCFFGNVFNRIRISSNGAITFNVNNMPPGNYHEWQFGAGQTIPNNSAAFRPNSIFGAMHDTDPRYGGTIRYGIQGAFPCRAFVMSFENIPHFDCHSKKTTQQIVLYEGTNAIEVYIQNKPGGCGWNGGRAAIGIQNGAGDLGYSPPGRNTGTWSASNEGWRFSPSGAPSYQITWHETNVTNPPVATGPVLRACPTTQMTTYSALLTYTNCAGEQNQFWRSVDVNLGGPATPQFTANSPVCENQTLTFNAPTVAGATYHWSGPNGWTSSVEDPSFANATTALNGNYNLYVVVNGCTSAVATLPITVVSATTTPVFSTNSPVCEGSPIQLNAQTYPGATYSWTGPNGFTSSLEDPVVPAATAAAGGTYNLSITVGACASGTASQTVTVTPAPAAPLFTSNSPVCTLTDIQFDGPSIPGATYSWTGPGGWTANTEDATRPNASVGMAGTYELTVTVNGCTSLPASQTVTVNGPDVPSFVTNAPICSGDTLTFSAPTIPGATYHWSGPNGWDPGNVDSATVFNANAAMSGNYSLYLVSNGCTSETVTSPVFITPLVAPGFTTNSPICAGQTIDFNGPVDTTSQYIWMGPLGWLSTVMDPSIPSATPSMSGNYSLTMVTLGCTTATSTQVVTVNPIPAAPNITSNSPVCEGQTINLNGPTLAGATYTWSGPNGFNSNTADNALSPSTLAMAGTYQLYVTVAGCSSATSSLNVVVNDVADITPTVTPLTPCLGQTVNFGATANVQPPSTIIASGWDVNGDGTPDYATPTATHAYGAAGNYNAIFGVITTGNCTSSVTVPIVVKPKPLLNYTGPSDQCGVTVALSAVGQVQPPATINNYTWYTSGGSNIGSGANLTHSFNATPFQQVTGFAVVTTSDGCSDSAAYSINLQPTPQVSFNVDECIGLTVPFNNTSTWIGTPPPGASINYNWAFGDGNGSTQQSPQHLYPGPGTYTVNLIGTSSAFNCSDTVQAVIAVSTPPTAQISAVTQCFQNVVLSAAINMHESGLKNIHWDLGDGSTKNDSSFVYEYQNSGTYTVTVEVTNAENCSTIVSVPVVILPSPTLSQIEIPNIITPNGDQVNDKIVLDTQFESCQNYEMLIFNRWGVEVYKQVKDGEPFNGYMHGGKKRLAAGVYFYTIKSGELQKNGTITLAY